MKQVALVLHWSRQISESSRKRLLETSFYAAGMRHLSASNILLCSYGSAGYLHKLDGSDDFLLVRK